MKMKWYADYIGLPYLAHGRSKAGLDCWGLVREVYRDRLNIELDSLLGEYLADGGRDRLRSIAGAFDLQQSKWQGVDSPREYDVAAFTLHKDAVYHVGIVVNDKEMIHVEDATGVCLQPFNRRGLYGFYRYIYE